MWSLYELQKFKNCDKPQNKHHKKRHKNVMHCFILNGKELPIHYSTIADIFRDVFRDVYLRSFKVLHFRSSHVGSFSTRRYFPRGIIFSFVF